MVSNLESIRIKISRQRIEKIGFFFFITHVSGQLTQISTNFGEQIHPSINAGPNLIGPQGVNSS